MQEKWWKEGVVYQIYPRSFCDSNGDGIGDIGGIISKLDYLQKLGVDVIWLSPVYKSPNCDNGYDISDYCDISPDFGTLEDMENLIEQAKLRNIRIIMDLVINHTSDEHEWFKKSKDKASKYHDYYIWKKPNGNKPPNNWGNFFAGESWEYVPEVGESYLHLFAKGQPDLNWKNPAVYEEIKKILNFWLEKGIAGFRCDVINIIYKNTLEDGKKQLVLTGIEHYHTTEGNHEILRNLRSDVFSKYDCFTVGETVLVDTKEAKTLCDRDRGELDMVFGFEHMDCDCISNKWFKTKHKPQKFIQTLDKWQREMEWNANYLSNHDQPRHLSRYGSEKYQARSAKALFGLNLSLKGTTFIYEGEEIGMTNGDFANLSEIQDVESHTVDKMAKKLGMWKSLRWNLIKKSSRDNARTPVQWTSGENAGFSTGKPWLKINANYKTVNAEVEEEDKESVLNFYRELIAFKRANIAIKYGDYQKEQSEKGTYVFIRHHKDQTLKIAINITDKPKKYQKGEVVFSNIQSESKTTLAPFEFVIEKI